MAAAARFMYRIYSRVLIGCVLVCACPAVALSAPYDLIVIKQIERGPSDALFVNQLDDKISQWVGSFGNTMSVHEVELPVDLQDRGVYLQENAPLSLHVRIVKDSQSAVVIFKIAVNEAAVDVENLSEFHYTKTLESGLIEAEIALENVLRTVIVPMLVIYQGATQGKQVLADCIRSEHADGNNQQLYSKRISNVYPNRMRQRSASPELGIHGLNRDQVAFICLSGAGDGPRYLSEHIAIRRFFDQIIYGDLDVGGERVYLTVENRNAADDQHTIAIPQTDADGKADELARQVLELISN
jgi:hypothetical protein